MATYQELRARSQQVRDEQNIGGNTALRVGQLLMDIVKYFYDNDAAASEYLQQHFAMVNDGTHLLNWQQSPIVILHTMGDDYDDGDFSALSQGENFYRNGFIMEADGQGGGINGEPPKANALYVNLANDTLYTWNGASFDAITSGGGGGSISGDDILKNAYYLNGNLVLVFETESGDKTVSIPVNFDASNYVPTSRTVNGKELSNNITLSQSDIPGLVAALAAKVKSVSVNNGTPAQPDSNGNVNIQVQTGSTISPADTAPQMDGTAAVGSSAKYAREDHVHPHDTSKQNTLTFDDAPTAGSNNPVKSGGIKTAIDEKLSQVTVNAIPAGSVAVIDGYYSDSATDVLSAGKGKDLNDRLLEVCGGISYEDVEKVVETTTDVTLTDGHFIRTGQGVGNVCPMTVDDYAGISYATFELKAGDKFFAKGVAGKTGNVGMLWAILDKTTHEILAVHDGQYTGVGSNSAYPTTPSVPDEETITVEQDCIVVVNAYNSQGAPAYGNLALTPYSFKKTTYTTEIVPEGTPVDGILGGMQEDIEELQEVVGQETSYKGMKLAALGDSITWGYTPRNSGGTAGAQLDSFAKLAAEKLGMTFSNHGISGSTVSVISGQNRNPMCQRYNDLPNDADVITFMGGVNDVSYNGVLGTMDDRGTDTFYGALHTIMQGLYTKYIGGVAKATGKKKKIIICTPIKSLDASKLTKTNSIANNADVLLQWDEWIEAIREVAAFYSFPVLDMYNLSSINPHLDRTVTGTTSWGATGYFNPYITDGVHPTQEGHEMMADVLVGFLKGLK